MDAIHYLRTVRRRWLLVLSAVLVAVAAGWATTSTVAPVQPRRTSYSATTLLWSRATGTIVGAPSVVDVNALVRFSTLPDMLAMAAKRLDYHGDPGDLRSHVQVSADPTSTGFLDVTAFSPNARQAEQLAEGFSAGLVDYLGRLQAGQLQQQANTIRRQIDALRGLRDAESRQQVAALEQALNQVKIQQASPVGLSVIQHATAMPVPVTGFQAPQSRTTRLLIAAAIGLLAGLALALVMERFDTRIRDRHAAERHFGFPVLAEVPEIRGRQRKGLSVADEPAGTPADAFRLLSVAVARASDDDAGGDGDGPGPEDGRGSGPMTVLVTSPGPSDGKTTIAANLAAVYGEQGKKVLIVSCDLRRPSIHHAFGTPERPGLAEALSSSNGRVSLEPMLTRVDNVAIVPSGVARGNPGELLGSRKMQQALEQAKEYADVVILDASPVLVANDITPLLTEVDTVLLVARANRTRAELAERTGEVLRRVGAPVAGLALNGAREISMPTGYHPYRYRYRVEQEPKRGRRRGRRRAPAGGDTDAWAG
ncbi:MAG: polysaccharide biosynthesis tyrosine autokinase [Candidatus Velamenicoccus archaeovorus]